MTTNSQSGNKNVTESMENKLTENSIILLLLIALAVSQAITFMRLHEYHKVINEQDNTITELVSGQASLFEIVRLQTELERLKSLKNEPPSWSGEI